jgi:nitroreductase
MDMRPWEFVVVRDAATRRLLGQVHEHATMAAQSPVVVVVCGRPGVSSFWVEDCSAATENLLLEATSLGLGTVWVAAHPFPEMVARVRDALGLPDEVQPLCIVPVGYGAESQPPRTRYDAARIHYEWFGRVDPAREA